MNQYSINIVADGISLQPPQFTYLFNDKWRQADFTKTLQFWTMKLHGTATYTIHFNSVINAVEKVK